jgi:hypothetical protein
MTFPEKGATYKHKPKFIERMKQAEKETPKPFTQGDGDADDVMPAKVHSPQED